MSELEAAGWRPITATEPPRHGNYVRVYTEGGALFCPLGGEATHYFMLPAPPGTSDEGRREPIARFELPVPPSTNNLYVPRRDGRGRAKTSKYAAWIIVAGWEIARSGVPSDALKNVLVEIGVPFSYKRDIDNVKPILDLLTTMHVIVDDRWVDELRVRRIPVGEPLVVSIWPI